MKPSAVIVTQSAEQTKKLSEKLAPYLRAGDVISLTGDLGAGKTTFVQGLAKGMGVKSRVTSPTFVLIKEYLNGLSLYHFDVYRLQSPAEFEELGYDEYFYNTGVSVVEWGDKIREFFPEEYLEISLKRSVRANSRSLELYPSGGSWLKRAYAWSVEEEE